MCAAMALPRLCALALLAAAAAAEGGGEGGLADQGSLLQLKAEPTPRKREKLLFFLPGIGCKDMERVRNVQESIEHVLSFREVLDIDCLVHSFVTREAWMGYAPNFLRWVEARCSIRYLPGAFYADHVKSLHPQIFERSGYDFLYLGLDDVVISGGPFSTLDLPAAVRTSRAFGLDIGSPRVEGAYWSPTRYNPDKDDNYPALRRSNVSGMLVEFVEIFSDLFTPRGWSCYWDNVDPVRFPNGWVADSRLPECRKRYESFRMGLYARQVVGHATNMRWPRCLEGPLQTYAAPDFRKPCDRDYFDSLNVSERLASLDYSLGYF